MCSNKNILPFDGDVLYLEQILTPEDSYKYFRELLENIPWSHDVVKMFGKTITTKRRIAWCSDSGIDYTYSGTKKLSQPWTERLVELKEIAEDLCKTEKMTIDITLKDGSLLIMKGETQCFWKHQLPVTKRVKEPRINLTFRQMQRREI